MSDPVFTDRAALEAWAAGKARGLTTKAQMLAVLQEVQRVTLANAHLLSEPGGFPADDEGKRT